MVEKSGIDPGEALPERSAGAQPPKEQAKAGRGWVIGRNVGMTFRAVYAVLGGYALFALLTFPTDSRMLWFALLPLTLLIMHFFFLPIIVTILCAYLLFCVVNIPTARLIHRLRAPLSVKASLNVLVGITVLALADVFLFKMFMVPWWGSTNGWISIALYLGMGVFLSAYASVVFHRAVGTQGPSSKSDRRRLAVAGEKQCS